MSRRWLAGLSLRGGIVLVIWCLGLSPGVAPANSEVAIVETGRLLATLLDAGRVTVGRNQGLLNDPSRGDKELHPRGVRNTTGRVIPGANGD